MYKPLTHTISLLVKYNSFREKIRMLNLVFYCREMSFNATQVTARLWPA